MMMAVPARDLDSRDLQLYSKTKNEEDTSNFRQTSSMVVSRCKLSNTTLHLNSDEYCLRFPTTVLCTFLAYYTVYFTMYGTHWRAGRYYLLEEKLRHG